MKIALLTDGIYPYVIGGMQRHSFYLAKYLAASGVKVDLYHTNPGTKDAGSLEGFSPEEKANIQSFVIKFPSLGKSPGHYIRESYTYSVDVWKVFKKQSAVDFIIAKGFAGWELLNQKSKGEHLPPVALNFHGYEMFQPPPDFLSMLKARLVLRSPVLFNIKNADYLFSYGGKITDLLLNLGIAKNRILELPTGISADWLVDVPRSTEPLRKLVFSGRYERRKGVEELKKVLRKLLPLHKNFEFHFIGPIPENKKLFSERIIYHGLVAENDKMKTLLRGMDVLVCPSYSEGMPNVVLEAMASGLAVLATDTGATSVMVNSENGWLIEPRDEAQLTDAFTQALKIESTALNAKKNNALRDVKTDFQWSNIIAKIIVMIEEKTINS
ncbi:MAG: glycosyltransferase family 4 protein [Bacteroidota bacterium]|nr:glycosyltransferase family 4 protein [Bacteroidota bacterium]